MSDARLLYSYFLAQEVAIANLHKIAFIFHSEVFISALQKNTGAYEISHLGKLFQ